MNDREFQLSRDLQWATAVIRSCPTKTPEMVEFLREQDLKDTGMLVDYIYADGVSRMRLPNGWFAVGDTVYLPDGRSGKVTCRYRLECINGFIMPDVYDVEGLGCRFTADQLSPLPQEQVCNSKT